MAILRRHIKGERRRISIFEMRIHEGEEREEKGREGGAKGEKERNFTE